MSNNIIKVRTKKDINRTGEDLHAAVVAHHFGVMATHDLKETMAKKGVEFPCECRIFEVCNPHQARKVLAGNMDISTALPCRISLYEEDGETVMATARPTAMLSFFGGAGVDAVAEEVEETMVAMMNDAAKCD
ncbi:MAG: DUF302 domain-containing protein [Verrucomicrobiae bacterium]|nr:DUF302 domain-containing protein [Verrucomicrobiae bacterium]